MKALVDRLLTRAPDVVYRYRVRPDPGFEFVSPAIEAILGISPEQLCADPALAATVLDDPGFRDQVMQSEGLLRDPYRVRVRRPDGQHRWLEVNNFTVLDLDGKVEVIEGIARDVTQQVEVEERLRVRARHLAGIERLAGVGSWTWDIETGAIAWSDGMYELYGLDRATYRPGFDASIDLIHPMDMESARAEMDRAMKAGSTFVFEHRYEAPDGTMRVFQARGEVVLGGDGTPTRMFGTSRDITEELYALAAERGKDVDLSGLSPREVEVLTLLADGRDARMIAKVLGITLNTARDHLKNIRRKLGVTTQLEAALIGIEAGLTVRAAQR